MAHVITDAIKVEFPHGAGGVFLASVLACCIKNQPWEQKNVNFHGTEIKIQSNHWFDASNNILSIDSPRARYNFWMYYFKKRVVHELKVIRYNNQRWVDCPYEKLTQKQSAYWLINQCRFIISYKSLQNWNIDWIQMITQPEAVWPIISAFLEANYYKNYWTIQQWVDAVNNYKQTLSKKIPINTYHMRWKIWAISMLHEQGVIPDFDIVDEFNTKSTVNWLNNHNKLLVEQTQNLVW